jgi:hypothetical protein
MTSLHSISDKSKFITGIQKSSIKRYHNKKEKLNSYNNKKIKFSSYKILLRKADDVKVSCTQRYYFQSFHLHCFLPLILEEKGPAFIPFSFNCIDVYCENLMGYDWLQNAGAEWESGGFLGGELF